MNKIPLVMILLIFKGQCFAAAHDNRQRAQQLPVGIERLPVGIENSFRNQLRAAESRRLGNNVVEDSLTRPNHYVCQKPYLDDLETKLFYKSLEVEGVKKDRFILLGTTCFFGTTTLLGLVLWIVKKNS
jgi:hypothetical protein